MKVYLVGGAVRDTLLHLPVKDRDWVVVGSSPELMLAKGFRPVGHDFPVFLHPDTGEEFALARTERKSGHGYSGFTFHAAEDVSLEEDLIRRDLTINAMAQDSDGTIIDPYGGQKDVKGRLLRHVSPSFQDDPLRILRVARFAARFHNLGFNVADETMQLMMAMVSDGEAAWLVAERVWQETVRALAEPCPDVYFTTLLNCGALGIVLPELSDVFRHHAAGAFLAHAAQEGQPEIIRFALLFSQSKPSVIHAFAKRIRCPAAYSELAQLTAEYGHELTVVLNNCSGRSVMNFFEQTDAFRRQERFYDLLTTLRITHSVAGHPIPAGQIETLKVLLKEALKIKGKEIVAQGITGRAVGEQLRIKRQALIGRLLADGVGGTD